MSVDQNSVTYRDIPGYPGYRVGDDGSVWSCHSRTGVITDKWHRLKCTEQRMTYRYTRHVVGLYRDRKSRVVLVHTLVLMAFVGPCPDGMEAAHLDGNPINNRLENLAWKTPQANTDDKRRHGTVLSGDAHPSAKLTIDQINDLLYTYTHSPLLEKKRVEFLAQKYGLSKTHVYTLLRGGSPARGLPGVKGKHTLVTYEFSGDCLTLHQWARRFSVPRTTMYARAAKYGPQEAIRIASEAARHDQ